MRELAAGQLTLDRGPRAGGAVRGWRGGAGAGVPGSAVPDLLLTPGVGLRPALQDLA